MHVAFLGLGRMGRPMADSLADGLTAGADRIVVWNRTAEKAEAFVEQHPGVAQRASTPAAAARGADVVVSMMADDAAADEVHLGPDGTLAATPLPAVVVESGTLAPSTVRRIAAAAAQRGSAFLDAPVSGSVDAARQGTLVLLVGGDADALERARPTLERLGREVVHLGVAGRGALAKLLVNGVLHALNQSVAEALALAEAAGLDTETFYDVLADSAAGAPMLGYRRAQYLKSDAPVSFALRLAAKDVALLVAEAEREGTPAAQARLVLAQLQSAVQAGYGQDDMAALARHLGSSGAGGGSS